MGRRRNWVAQRWVSLADNGGLQKWRIRAGWGDFVISDGDLRVDREECEAPLLIENGWRVRRLVQREEEMRRVAAVQAEAFYSPMAFFNGFFFEIFEAEVLAALLYRIKNSAPNRYACLVAETDGKLDSHAETHPRLVGVVDITVLRNDSVLQFLEGADEYLYVSGIAVLTAFRRRKIATVLLKACDLIATLWKFDHLVLRAYEDDMGARKLYTKAGYRVVSKDPIWMTSWIGRRRRVLMIKRTPPAEELSP
ncbi:unnamed protein product [Victoria cruziana]